MPRKLLSAIALAVTLIAPGQASELPEREYIYGAELMTPKEREDYRARLGRAKGDEARGEYRQRHRERLQKRAGERGVELDEKGIVRRRGESR